jgi:hypothetical protein
MSDEEQKIEDDGSSFYDEVRADIETAVYSYATLEEIDSGLLSKGVQKDIQRAKQDCITIICKGIELIRVGYELEDE